MQRKKNWFCALSSVTRNSNLETICKTCARLSQLILKDKLNKGFHLEMRWTSRWYIQKENFFARRITSKYRIKVKCAPFSTNLYDILHVVFMNFVVAVDFFCNGDTCLNEDFIKFIKLAILDSSCVVEQVCGSWLFSTAFPIHHDVSVVRQIVGWYVCTKGRVLWYFVFLPCHNASRYFIIYSIALKWFWCGMTSGWDVGAHILLGSTISVLLHIFYHIKEIIECAMDDNPLHIQ